VLPPITKTTTKKKIKQRGNSPTFALANGHQKQKTRTRRGAPCPHLIVGLLQAPRPSINNNKKAHVPPSARTTILTKQL